MKKQISTILIFFLFAISCNAQQPKKITDTFFPDADSLQNVTPALQKKKGFTNYEELIGFLNQIQQKYSDYIKIEFIGKTQKGLDIPLVIIDKNPNKSEKIKVWMQGGLHGNEPASTEGLLYFIHTIANNPEEYNEILDKTELRIVPMANIDGYLKQDRFAANGLDLNRDQTKLMAPETVVLKKSFSEFNPQVGIDFHEYNPFRKDFAKMGDFGISFLFDVMFLYSGNLNVPKDIRNITDSLFVKEAKIKLDKNNLSHHDYMTTDNYHGETVFNLGSDNARSSATNYALTDAISTLIEVRGVGLDRTSFKRRIFTTFLIADSYLKTAVNNKDTILKTLGESKPNSEITIISTKSMYNTTIPVINMDDYERMDYEITVKDALKSQAKMIRSQPFAYIVESQYSEVLDKLKLLGIKVDKLDKETSFAVESYIISDFSISNFTYEQMILQTVKTDIIPKQKSFPSGTFIIYTNQKNTPLLNEVLEPEAPNSFVSFGIIKTGLNQELPIYRIPLKNYNDEK